MSTATVDGAGKHWSADATFLAGTNGVVDTAHQAPTSASASGSYRGVDAAGLLWSMRAHPQQDFFVPPASGHYQVTVSVQENGHNVASGAITRDFRLPTVHVTQLRPQTTAGLVGTYYAPANAARRPAVLTFGGSEGGQSQNEMAGLLASRGYPTLSLAYFGEPGLPKSLVNIPLEYFAAAARWLAAQPGVSTRRIWVRGGSRGSEAALLLGVDYPSLVHGVIADSPSSVANVSPRPDTDHAAWTWHGKPVATAPVTDFGQLPTPERDRIPVAQINGPLITICGQDDQIWPSCGYSQEIAAARGSRNTSDEYLSYPGAGHYIGGLVQNQPLGNFNQHGGNSFDLERGLRDAWAHLLAELGEPTS